MAEDGVERAKSMSPDFGEQIRVEKHHAHLGAVQGAIVARGLEAVECVESTGEYKPPMPHFCHRPAPGLHTAFSIEEREVRPAWLNP